MEGDGSYAKLGLFESPMFQLCFAFAIIKFVIYYDTPLICNVITEDRGNIVILSIQQEKI